MDVSAYKRRFEQLIDTVLKDDIEINAYHSGNILKYLDGSRDKCTGTILESPFFAELIIYSLWNFDNATTSVKVFIVDMASIVLSNEVNFNRFLHMQGFELQVSKLKECRAMPAALHCAHVRQAASLATHYTGLKYLVDQKCCRQLLRPDTHKQPPTLASSIYDFVSKLIWKLNEYDEEVELRDTLQLIVDPIMTIDLKSTASQGVECEKVIGDQLLTYFHTLVSILGETDKLIVLNKVVPTLMGLGLEFKLAALLEETREPALAGLLAELIMRYNAAAARHAALCDPAAEGRVNGDLNILYNGIVGILVKNRCIFTVLDFNYKCHMFFHKLEKLGASFSFERFGGRFQLQNLFVIMLMVPLYTKSKAQQRLVDDQELQEAFETFTHSLVKYVPYDLIKCAYSMKHLVMETGTVAACVCAVRKALQLHGRLTRRQAGLVFQSLYYALSEYVLSDGAGALVLAHNPLRSPEDEQLVGFALDAIGMLLEEHDITWYDSLEILNLQAALTNLVKQNILPTKLLVQVLELMTLSVRKLLSPELALLLRSERGGSLREAGAAARALLDHPEWPVRVAALHLIHSFTEVAYVKFAALRAVIAEQALAAGAARAALAAGAPLAAGAARAQAVALRCLAAAARCECLWQELLALHRNLYEQLLYIIQHNADGEVRKEAVEVLTNVFVHHKVSKTFTSCVSRVMARTAARAACAPAQLAALRYWIQLTKNLWSERGFIDGRFPTVTFSKESRKIITLTDQEILKQIHAIMDDMSVTGCLYVFLQCLRPHNDVEVIELARKACEVLIGALDRYKFRNEAGGYEPNAESEPAADRMNQDQTDLISEIFESMDLNSSQDEDTSPVKVIHPYQFLEIYKAMDSEAIIKSKSEASKAADLDTLIDEVIALGNS